MSKKFDVDPEVEAAIRADERIRCAEYIEAAVPLLLAVADAAQNEKVAVIATTSVALGKDLRQWDGVDVNVGTPAASSPNALSVPPKEEMN